MKWWKTRQTIGGQARRSHRDGQQSRQYCHSWWGWCLPHLIHVVSAKTAQIFSDNTDVFVLMVCWCWKVHITCHLQMERRDGTVLNINSTVENLSEHCHSILAMHALSGCDSTFYPVGKGNVSTLGVGKNIDTAIYIAILCRPIQYRFFNS